jgi:dynein assembly factor 2
MANAGVGDMNVTQEEVSKLTRAMKNDQFRSHMDEYCKEISDPAHRKEYLDYLAQLEAKGEMPDGQQLLRCQPGCCVKTTLCFKNGQTQKCFINIVHSERLEDLSFGDGRSDGQNVKLPYSLSPPRPDRDNKDQYCLTCDMAVGRGTFHQAVHNPQILKMLVDTASDGLGSQFLKGFEEVRKDFKVMQRIQCKGREPMPMSVKGELLKAGSRPAAKPTLSRDGVTPGELKKMRADAKERMKADEEPADDDGDAEEVEVVADAEETSQAPRVRVPKHRLVHSGSVNLADYMQASHKPTVQPVSIPKTLKLVVELPSVKKSSDILLEVTSDNVVV